MLSKERRISRKLFQDSLLNSSERPQYSSTHHFSLRSAPSPTGGPHVAVSVSKKISKKAVVRNTVRRRVYSQVALFFSSLKPNLFSVTAKAGSDKIKGQKLQEELQNLFREFLKR